MIMSDNDKTVTDIMRSSALAIVSVICGAVFVGLAGVLTIRVIGAESGAVFDLNNVVVGVRPPHTAYLPMLALAVLAVVAAYVVIRGTARLRRRDRLVVAVSFAFAVLGLVVWGSHGGWLHGPEGQLAVGVPEGWRGWLREGARSSGVHVVLVIVIGWAWMLGRSSQAVSRGREPEPYSSDVDR